MTVYYYDLFTGTAGTLLTSHTADSGATWPNDANHLYEYNSIQLDGNGAVFLEGSQPTLEIPSATQPSSQNFEVLFTFKRLSALSGSSSGVELLRQAPFTSSAEDYAFVYNEGSGFTFLHSGTPVGGYADGPTVGTLWHLKVDVSTSGGNTSFASYYSTTSGGTWTALTNYSVATPSDAVAAGLRFVGTSATTTTGHHIGDLTVQDIPALSSATLSGPTQQLFSNPAAFTVGLNEPAGTGGVVVTLSSSNSSDTFQATQGGANVTTITIPSGSESGTFWLTPRGTTGNRTITIATSPTLTYSGSPFTYNAMTTATGYTVTGASGGHQLVPVEWTITLTGGDFSGTITGTPGGGIGQCQIFSPIMTTFTGNGTLSKTFTFTPLDQDSVTYTFANSGSLTNPSPVTFTATRVYYQDTFQGTGGTSIASWTSNALPGLSGTQYRVTGSGTIELDGSTTDSGSGMCYCSSAGSGATYAVTQATLPTWPQVNGVEILFDVYRWDDGSGAGGIVLYLDSSPDIVYIILWPGQGGGSPFAIYQNGNLNYDCYTSNIPPVGQLWTIKLDLVETGGWMHFSSYYSTDGGATYNELLTSAWPGGYQDSTIPSIIAVGPYFQYDAGGPTSGVHIGNIIVQDPAPPPPNCSISKAYVTTSGQSVAFFFETGLTGNGGTAIIPTPSACGRMQFLSIVLSERNLDRSGHQCVGHGLSLLRDRAASTGCPDQSGRHRDGDDTAIMGELWNRKCSQPGS